VEFSLRRPAQLPFVRMAVGELCNDGRCGFLVLDADGPELVLDAFSLAGRPLWGFRTGLPARGGWDGRSWHVPFAAWDVNADGRTEVLLHAGPGGARGDDSYEAAGPDERLVALDAATGEVVWQVPWPARRPRVMLTVAHLDGPDEPACAVVLDGTYGDELVTAVDGATCHTRWQVRHERPAGHNLDAADLTEDGAEQPLSGGELPLGARLKARNHVCVDLLGDYREEFAGIDHERGTVFVATNPAPTRRRAFSPMQDFAYRHERSQLGSGYYTYIAPPMLWV